MSIITAGMKHTASRLVAGFPRAGTAEPSEARKQSVTSTAGPSVPRAPGLFYLLAISIAKTSAILPILLCRGGGTGRRAGFKIRFLHGSAGSIPALGTNSLFHYCFSPIDTVPLSLVGLFPDRSPDKFYGPGENIGGGRRKLMLSMSSTRVCTREGIFKEVLCVVFT